MRIFAALFFLFLPGLASAAIDPPGAVAVSPTGVSGQLLFSWAAVTDTPTVTGYQVYRATYAGVSAVAPYYVTSTADLSTGLQDGQPEWYAVSADPIGSTLSVTISAIPFAPIDASFISLTAQSYGAGLLLRWTSPVTHGYDVGAYQISQVSSGTSSLLETVGGFANQAVISVPCAAGVTLQVQAVDVLGLTGTASNTVAAAYPCAPVVQATGLSSSALTLAWSATPGVFSPFASYQLRYAQAAGTAEPLTLTDSTVAATQTAATAAAIAQSSSRWFRVYGVDLSGVISPGSNEVAQLAPPVSLTAGTAHGEAFLSWARPDATTDFKLTGYQVYYATYSPPLAGAPGTQIQSVADQGSGSFAYATVTGLTDSVPITFALAAQGGDGVGAVGAMGLTVSVTPRLPDPVILSYNQPQGMTITVSWQAVNPGALTPATYTLFAAQDQAFTGLTPLASLTSTSMSFGALPVPGLQYWFVTVSDSAGNGSNPLPSSLLFAPALSTPTPSVVSSSDGRIQLQWPAVPNASTYQVYRATLGVSTTAASFTTLSAWEIAGTSFVDTRPANGQPNLYEVLARTQPALPASVIESPLSLSVSAAPLIAPGIPGAYEIPSASNVPRTFSAYLTATARPTLDGADLSWAPSSPGSSLISCYQVNHGDSFDSLTFAANVPANVTTYGEAILDPLGEVYGVTAIDLSGNVSVQLTGTPSAYFGWPAPQSPSAFTLGSAAHLSWSAPLGQGSYPFSAYAIYRMDQSGSVDLLRGSTTNTAFVDLNASSARGSSLNYGIVAVDSLGLTGTAVRVGASFSPPAYTGVTPSAPSLIGAQVLTASGGALNTLVQWQPNPQAEQVSAYQLSGNGIFITTTASLSGMDFSPVLDSQVTYKVNAVNAAGSGLSGTASPAPLSIDPPQPGAASALFASDSSGNTVPTQHLQWADLGVGSSVTAYKVYRSNGVFSGVGSATALSATLLAGYGDSSVSPGAYQAYAIVSMIGSSESASPVAQVALTVTAAPVAPTGLTCTVSSAAVNLRWVGHTQDREYLIYRSSTVPGIYPDMSTRIGTSTGASFADTAVDATAIQYYSVTAVNELGRGAGLAVTVTPLPGPVTGVGATPGFNGGPQISLAWSPPGAPSLATSYEISRATAAAGPFSALNMATSPPFVDSSVSTNTAYYYQVRAFNLAFSMGNPIVGPVRDYNLAPAPSGLQARGGPAGIDLAWDLPSSALGVTGYALTLTSWDGLSSPQLLSLPSQPPAYSITGLATAQGVSITLQAGNSAGYSPSALASGQVNAAGPAELAMSFTATVGFYESNTTVVRVVLGWTPMATTVTALVYRSSSPIPLSLAAGGPASPLYLTGVSGSNGGLSDTAVTAGDAYYYALTAVSPAGLPGGESLASRLDAVSPFNYPNPVQLTVTAGVSRVDLQWSPAPYAGSYGLAAVPYRLYRYLTNDVTSHFGTAPDSGFPLDMTSTAYADLQVQNGNPYQYFVSAVDSLGHEQVNPSGVIGVTPLGPRPGPAGVLAVPGDASVALRWLGNQQDAGQGLKFNVYRRQAGQDYGPPLPSLTMVGPAVQEFQGTVTLIVLTLRDTDSVVNKTTYCYSLTQVNDYGEGGKSQEVCVTPYRPLAPAVGTLNLQVSGKKDVALSWNNQLQTVDPTQSFPMTGFRIYRSQDGGITYTLLSTTAVVSSSFLDNTTGFGGAYVYRVVPLDGAGNEGFSYSLANVVIPSSINAVLVFRNSFNPAKGETAAVQYSLLQPGHAWVKVFTQQGEYVVTLFDENVAQATADTPYLSDKKNWDGRNAQGQIVASGVYLIHLEAPGYRANARVAVIK